MLAPSRTSLAVSRAASADTATNRPEPSVALASPPVSPSGPVPASPAHGAPASVAAAEAPVPYPVLLQQRATRAVQAHARRVAVRLAALLACDLVLLVVLERLFHAVRDDQALGTALANLALALVPRGSFDVMQLLVALLGGLAVAGAYGEGDRRREPARLLSGVTLGLTLAFWNRFWGAPHVATLAIFALATLAVTIPLILVRYGMDLAARARRRRHAAGARALVVGPLDACRRALAHPVLTDAADYALAGYVPVRSAHAAADASPETPAQGADDTAGHADALGRLEDFVSVVARHEIDTVVLAGGVDETVFATVVDLADQAGCEVLQIPNASDWLLCDRHMTWRKGRPIVALTRPGLRVTQLVLKRLLDVVASGLGLLILAPLLGTLALVVRSTSPGPVFFRQERVGMRGRRFEILKFRSMVVDAEARKAALAAESVYDDARLFKMTNDPRVTAFGRVLRQTSLDELPQLWNVLVGDMSLVGPRPPVPQEVALYEAHHFTRFDMKPGITGPWQVGGRNRITDFEEVVRLETAYLRHWTLWKDLVILAKTIPVVLGRDGAH